MNILYKYCGKIVGGFAGFICYLVGGYDNLFEILVIMTAIDFLTGWIAAAVNNELSSELSAKGILKKIGMFCVVAIAHLVDRSVGVANTKLGIEIVTGLVRPVIIFAYIGTEGFSALENLARSNIWIPKRLSRALKQVKNAGGGNNNEKKNNN